MASSKKFKAYVRAFMRLVPGASYAWCLHALLDRGVSDEVRAEALRWKRLSPEERKREREDTE